MMPSIMTFAILTLKGHHAEYHYAELHCTDCHGATLPLQSLQVGPRFKTMTLSIKQWLA
jgi:hypothetical protein